MNLEDRSVVVTGGASGIGRALASAFLDAGARGVTIADIDAGALAQTAAGLASARLNAIQCDVSSEKEVNALIAAAEDAFGATDVFMANAGVGSGDGLAADDDQWAGVLRVNVWSHIYAARALVPRWTDRGEGYFVATASAAGLLTQIGDAPYAVSKHACVAFAEWLAVTYGSRGLRVSCLCPMAVETPLLRGGLGGRGEEDLATRTAVATGEILAPDDVATLVLQAMREERFLILPHPEVAEFARRKAADHDRWIAGMRRLQAEIERSV